MNCETREEQGITIAALSGDVDLQSSPEVRKILIECVDQGKSLVVDLSGVGYIDSSGVASLVESFQRSRKHGHGFVLVAVSEGALRVLKLARLDKVFTICDTLEEGLSSLSK